MILAPGASSHGAYAPAKGQSLPHVDERLVAPEAHAEILDGRVYRTMGANPPHATQHFHATAVFAGVLADGYTGAVDMLTRADAETDAAPDVSIFPSAPDPETGERRIEEIAFEVLDTERLSHTTKKVEKFAARGVRRLFAVRLSTRTVYEWDHMHHDWTELDASGEIVDRCFRVPLPVRALVDRVRADDTIARALLAANNPVIEDALAARAARSRAEGHSQGRVEGHTQGRVEGRVEGRAEGRVEGRAEGQAAALSAAVLRVLARRGVAVDDVARTRIADCTDVATLEHWLDEAVTATHVDALFRG